MALMDWMTDRWMRSLSPQQKLETMSKMMPRMMEQWMGSAGSGEMMEVMHEMMPHMMESCLGSRSSEGRREMLTFCQSMLSELQGRYGVRSDVEWLDA